MTHTIYHPNSYELHHNPPKPRPYSTLTPPYATQTYANYTTMPKLKWTTHYSTQTQMNYTLLHPNCTYATQTYANYTTTIKLKWTAPYSTQT